MCGLIFVNRPAIWPGVVKANLARAGRNKGAFTYTTYTPGLTAVEMLDTNRVVSGNDYAFPHPGVTHLQAPTSIASRPHPAQAPNTLLWHNGLFQPSGIAEMQRATESTSEWDTALIALAVSRGFDSDTFLELGKIAGSFACIAYTGSRLYAFRNAIAPLYVDAARLDTLSSVPVGDVNVALKPGVVYEFWDDGGQWAETSYRFENSHNPYGI